MVDPGLGGGAGAGTVGDLPWCLPLPGWLILAFMFALPFAFALAFVIRVSSTFGCQRRRIGWEGIMGGILGVFVISD